MITVLSVSQLLKGKVSILVFAASFLVSLILLKLAEKMKISWMKEFVLAFALIVGMGLSIIFESMLL